MHRYEIGASASCCLNTSTVTIDGLSAPARQVGFDAQGRTRFDVDAAGVRTEMAWNDLANLPVIVTTAAGTPAAQTTTTAVDSRGRPTTTFGPGPASCFAPVLPTPACVASVATTSVTYDGGLLGLAGAFSGSRDGISGAACAHNLVPLPFSWGEGTPGCLDPDYWGGRLTGDIDLPANITTLALDLDPSDSGRLFIDDILVHDASVGPSPPITLTSPWSVGRHRIRIDFTHGSGSARLGLMWGTSASGTLVANSALHPRYDLVTSR
ncbi:MAG: hypothetical protein ACT4OS_00255 [Acidimicrobiales bacterium]